MSVEIKLDEFKELDAVECDRDSCWFPLYGDFLRNQSTAKLPIAQWRNHAARPILASGYKSCPLYGEY